MSKYMLTFPDGQKIICQVTQSAGNLVFQTEPADPEITAQAGGGEFAQYEGLESRDQVI